MKKEVENLKRNLIIQTSMQHFEEHGFSQTKVADIAKKMGISVGTIYSHFDSKENLYFQCIFKHIEQFNETLEKHYTNNPRENIKVFLTLKFNSMIKKQKVLQESWENDPFFSMKIALAKECPLENIYAMLEKEFKEIIGKEDKDYRLMAISFNRFSDAYLEHWLRNKFDIMNQIDDIIDTFLYGVEK